MNRQPTIGIATALVVAVLAAALASCTESCYKQEENFADAGDSPAAARSDEETDGCRVGVTHFQTGMTHPDEPCLTCRFLEDGATKGWTPLADGASCDDHLFCTGGGYCAGGRCLFSGNPCPGDRPFCSEQYGGVCTAEPLGGAGDNDGDACWVCDSTSECVDAFGTGWGCLDGCCRSGEGDDGALDDDLADDDLSDDDLGDDDLDDDTSP